MAAKQKTYDISEEEEFELWILISRVRKELLMASDRELRHSGLSSVQMGILHALYNARQSGVLPNLSDLSRWVIRQHNTVSVMLTSMEKRGLVQLERSSQKRSVRISITDKGYALYEEVMEKRKAIPDILGSLSPKEREQLRNLLLKMDQKARDLLLNVPFP